MHQQLLIIQKLEVLPALLLSDSDTVFELTNLAFDLTNLSCDVLQRLWLRLTQSSSTQHTTHTHTRVIAVSRGHGSKTHATEQATPVPEHTVPQRPPPHLTHRRNHPRHPSHLAARKNPSVREWGTSTWAFGISPVEGLPR
jgi:hypothetical protein